MLQLSSTCFRFILIKIRRLISNRIFLLWISMKSILTKYLLCLRDSWEEIRFKLRFTSLCSNFCLRINQTSSLISWKKFFIYLRTNRSIILTLLDSNTFSKPTEKSLPNNSKLSCQNYNQKAEHQTHKSPQHNRKTQLWKTKNLNKSKSFHSTEYACTLNVINGLIWWT